MKLMFASLLCHRDVEIFRLNWFVSRAFLDHGFDIPHLVLNDGSLTEQDIKGLLELPGIVIDPDPIVLFNVPNPVLVAKLQCFERGFDKYGADRIVIIDPDVFIYKPWDSVVTKILLSGAICLQDWGSSLGPCQNHYKDLFGVIEDAHSHSCNTGLYSIPRELYSRIPPVLEKHIKNPFQIMEDQGIFFAAFYGMLDYITDIQCLINGMEDYGYMWDWVLNVPKGSHLQGMRVRLKALNSLVGHVVNLCPKEIHLSQITPANKFINYGMLAYGFYDFTKPWQRFPSQWNGSYVLDGMYIHAGSWVEWKLAPQFTSFKSKCVCMHTGDPLRCKPVRVNGCVFPLESDITIPLNGYLKIETDYSEGGHLCFLKPILSVRPLYQFKSK